MLVLFNQNTDCSYRAAVDLIRKACTSKLGYDFLATDIQNFQKIQPSSSQLEYLAPIQFLCLKFITGFY